MKKNTIFCNEKGAILIIVLIILSLLTIISIATTTTSIIESQIVLNERKRKENLYAVQAAALEAAQRLENSSNFNLVLTPKSTDTVFDINNSSTWFKNSVPLTNFNLLKRRNEKDTLRYKIENDGIVNETTITISDIGKSILYKFSIYGLYRGSKNNGQAYVKMGYKKRFIADTNIKEKTPNKSSNKIKNSEKEGIYYWQY